MKTKEPKALAFESSAMLDASTSDLRVLEDGYLVANPRVARTGIQIYRGVEVGRPDLAEVRIYRPEAEVFSRDAMKTLAGKPVTLEHPLEPVNSKNWRDVAVGRLGDEVVRDGEFIRVPLMLMDAAAIAEVRKGRHELSVGYSAILHWADGTTPDGEPYHAKQTFIRANHVAITHAARGGSKLRMGDMNPTKQEVRKMATRTIIVDSIDVELEDRDAQLIERALNRLNSDLAAANTALATTKTTAANDTAAVRTELATVTTASNNKDAEIATLKAQLADAKVTPKKLNEMARARAGLEQRAKALLDSVVIDDKSDEEIRRQVVSTKLGDTAKDWNDDMVAASFNTLAVSAPSNGLQHVVNVMKHNDNFTGGVDPVAAAYKEYDDQLTNRWKTAGNRAAV